MEEMFEKDFDNRPIGVFDSGIGGLTVLKCLTTICPNENYIYYGDIKNLPYGEKTKDELLVLIKRIFDFFKERNVKAVVMACNTSSAQVYEELKDLYDYQIFTIIQQASECIAQDKSIQRIGVLATNATVSSGMYSKSLKMFNPKIDTIEIACPGWVPIVEKKVSDDSDEIILKYLKPVLDFNPNKIILGCTHYPYLMDRLSKYAPKEIFIDPAVPFSEYIKESFTPSERNHKGTREYIVSANPEEFMKNSSMFMQIDSAVKEVRL